eukprot:GHVN01026728.1.p1 GENE.GHVN01026728.1~~GHVN01026728.1.p1  ORF type:complete len:109 (-),score=2.26 GHVN01026728.1:373-699(-)
MLADLAQVLGRHSIITTRQLDRLPLESVRVIQEEVGEISSSQLLRMWSDLRFQSRRSHLMPPGTGHGYDTLGSYCFRCGAATDIAVHGGTHSQLCIGRMALRCEKYLW